MTGSPLSIALALVLGLSAPTEAVPPPTESASPVERSAPPKALAGYQFDGQLVYRTSDGQFVPLFPKAIFVGWGDDGCEPANQSSERFAFYPDGDFQLTISPVITTTIQIATDPTGQPLSRRVGADVVRWPCYRFHVEGCDDSIVRFGPTAPQGRIELNCPGRKTGARRDG